METSKHTRMRVDGYYSSLFLNVLLLNVDAVDILQKENRFQNFTLHVSNMKYVEKLTGTQT